MRYIIIILIALKHKSNNYKSVLQQYIHSILYILPQIIIVNFYKILFLFSKSAFQFEFFL